MPRLKRGMTANRSNTIVMPGLDPGISRQTARDRRIKSGDDE
jgi:hypothetical protein